MIELTVRVQTIISHWAVQELGGQPATWEWTQRMDPKKPAADGKKNAFAGINAQGPAKVTVDLEEKLSGPSGTYSTVSIRVGISVRCDQSEEAITHARDVLMREGTRALEFYAGPAVNLLMEHTRKQGRK
jgi:hypothetical protein